MLLGGNTPVSLLVAEVSEALIAAGAAQEKAKAAAAAIPVGGNLATQADIGDVKADIAKFEVRMANEFEALYRYLWMLAAGIVSLTVALVKLIP